MARERKTEKLTLVKPTEFTFQRDGQDASGWQFTSIDGEEFNTFDPALVKAFNDKDLKGTEAEYVYLVPERDNQKPSIVEIVGVYKSSGSGWKGGGGMSNRQAAALAAGSLLSGQKDALKTLEDGRFEFAVAEIEKIIGPGAQAETKDSEKPAEGSENGSQEPEEAKVKVESAEDLEALVKEAFGDREKLAANFLKTVPKRYGKKALDEMTPDEWSEIAEEAMQIAEA